MKHKSFVANEGCGMAGGRTGRRGIAAFFEERVEFQTMRKEEKTNKSPGSSWVFFLCVALLAFEWGNIESKKRTVAKFQLF